MLSYAGTGLPVAAAGLRSWCGTAIPYDWLCLWDVRCAMPPGLAFLDPPRPWDRGPVVLETLRWPTGAARWAYIHLAVDAATLDQLRPVVLAQGTATAAPLVLSDGSATVTTNLFPLPPRPLWQLGGPVDCYLLTLVDERYYWWFRARLVGVTGGTTTWLDLFDQIALGLNVALDVDDIPAAYVKPSVKLGVAYQSLPLLLDAAAASVGLRFARQLNGDCQLLSAQTAKDQVQNQLQALRPSDLLAGGLMTDTDRGALLPRSVDLVCDTWRGGASSSTPAVYANTLAGLALSDFPGLAGFDGIKVLHTTGRANFTLIGDTTASNNTEMTALARQAATDYYRWLAAGYRLDRALCAYPSWKPTATEDQVEWSHNGTLSTRILPFPPADRREELFHNSSAGETEGAPPAGGALTVKTDTGTQIYTDVTTLVIDDPVLVLSRPGATQAEISQNAASSSTLGYVSLLDQTMGDGDKVFQRMLRVMNGTAGPSSFSPGLGVYANGALYADALYFHAYDTLLTATLSNACSISAAGGPRINFNVPGVVASVTTNAPRFWFDGGLAQLVIDHAGFTTPGFGFHNTTSGVTTFIGSPSPSLKVYMANSFK